MAKVAAAKNNETLIQQTKAKMAETAKEYVPVPVEDDPWTIKDRVPTTTLDEAVAMCMALVKAARSMETPSNDTYLDLAAYVAIAGQLHTEENELYV